ncbi:zinc finger protein 513 [Rhipicephalus sanguineus]|nr:zinc finger protein 513 [Rhipicephalus sanguineus]
MGFTKAQATEAAPTNTVRPLVPQLASFPPSLRESQKQETMELFSCDLCSFSSIYADDLKKHVRTHSGKEELLCLVCQHAFSDVDSLRQHSSTHAGERKYTCNLCPYAAVSSNNLARHKLTHTGERNFACSLCTYVCTPMDSLRRHVNRVHLGILFIANSHDITLQMATGFTEVQATEAASTNIGRPLAPRLAPRPPGVTASQKQKTAKLYSCDLCSFTSIYAKNTRNHVRTHSGKEEGLLCLVCLRTFPDTHSLKRHGLTHTGEKKYKCSLCPYATISSTFLQRHVRTHTGEKNFVCGVCACVFARMDTLKRHINKVHLGNKPRRRK